MAYGEIKKSEPKKTNIFFLQKMYDHQNLQDADVWWGKAHNKFTRLWSRGHKKLGVKLKT